MENPDAFFTEIEPEENRPSINSVIVRPSPEPVKKKPRGLAAHANRHCRSSEFKERSRTTDSPIHVERKTRGSASHTVYADRQYRSAQLNKRSHTVDSPHRPRGVSSVKRVRTPESAHDKVVWPIRPPSTFNYSTSPKTFDSKGTQTERTGACKCARAVQNRNKQKRMRNKLNNQIVQVLERTDIIRVTNEYD